MVSLRGTAQRVAPEHLSPCGYDRGKAVIPAVGGLDAPPEP